MRKLIEYLYCLGQKTAQKDSSKHNSFYFCEDLLRKRDRKNIITN